MKLSLEWLRELINVPWSDGELVDRLARAGVGTESLVKGVLDLEIFPNRGDLLSALGVAREIRALTGEELRYTAPPPLPTQKANLKLSLDAKFVPRYTAALIRGIRIAPTKNKTIVRRLEASGMRPVNNIVDLTNYVMLETGHPSHAFDFQKIRGGLMRVRKAKKGESLVTLDGVKRILPEGALIITDSDRIIDLAGIMGGQTSEIDANTHDVLLQAAVFAPATIRAAAKALGLSTEASYRYERQVDGESSLVALTRLVSLVREEAGGSVESVVDVNHLPERPEIRLSLARLERLVGVGYPEHQVQEVLQRLGGEVHTEEGEWVILPPLWRHDLVIEADLIEEVARIIGYATIPSQPLPPAEIQPSADYLARESLKDWLVEQGLSEVMTYSLLSEEDLMVSATPAAKAVTIANPLSKELAYFRSSLLPGLLKTVAKNPTWEPLRIFEIGRVATRGRESVQVGLLFAGKGAGEIEAIAKKLGLRSEKVEEGTRTHYKIRKSDVFVVLGDWEKVKHHFAEVIQLRVSETTELREAVRLSVKPISKYPSVVRDISIVVDETARNDEIKMAIAGLSEYIHLVELFDEFSGPSIGAGQKSLAFHVHYQDPAKTMTGKEIAALHGQVEALLKRNFRATIR